MNTNFTASDILDNDFDTIIDVINANTDGEKESLKEESEVMSLGDFMDKL